MKTCAWLIFISMFLASTVLLFVFYSKHTQRQTKRAELYVLDIIKGRMLAYLEVEGRLPTNWLTLSNAIDYELTDRIAERYNLPPLSESYSILSRTVFVDDHVNTGSVFILRTHPISWPNVGVGRWALAASSNRVFRIWLPEDRLPSEIRSQLTNQP